MHLKNSSSGGNAAPAFVPGNTAVHYALRCWFFAESNMAVADKPPVGDFPWGTKGNLNRIGEKLRNSPTELSAEDARTLETWRASHFNVMNAFNAMLRKRTRSLAVTVARRHKRRVTIIDKLTREPGMQLARMDDVAGIRLIFHDIPSLVAFRSSFLKSAHNHEKKNRDDKYNYLESPKETGYRGVHDVYAYRSTSPKHSLCNGTMIEVQYRTVHNHAWATANEVVTMITPGQRTKFNQADANYMEFFKLSSEMFARAFDGMKSVYPEMTNTELLRRFDDVEKKTQLVSRLNGLNVVRAHIRSGSVILRFTPEQSLIIMPVPRFQDVMKFYFQAESEYRDDDVVLVNAPDASGIRSAYRNYFSDTTEFLSYLDAARIWLREQEAWQE